MSLNFKDINSNKYYQIKSVVNNKYIRFYSLNTKYVNASGNDNVFVASSDFGGSKFRFETCGRLISTMFMYCEGHEFYDNKFYTKDFRMRATKTNDSHSHGNLAVLVDNFNSFDELFKVLLNKDGTISLYSWGLQRWISAPNGGKSALKASSARIGKAEKFRLVEVTN